MSYSLLSDGEYDKDFREVYSMMIAQNVELKGEEWKEEHDILVNEIIDLFDRNYNDIYELALDFADTVINTPAVQERENYWIKQLDQLSERGLEEINLVAGSYHVIPSNNNFYSKMKDNGYEVEVNPLRTFPGEFEEAFIWNLHSH